MATQEVDLEGEATPGRAAVSSEDVQQKGNAQQPAGHESPERARPGSAGARPPETPEQATEGDPRLDADAHSPVLDPVTPGRPE
jgi:hypothetical protein